jgi:hypothetical protein
MAEAFSAKADLRAVIPAKERVKKSKLRVPGRLSSVIPRESGNSFRMAEQALRWTPLSRG